MKLNRLLALALILALLVGTVPAEAATHTHVACMCGIPKTTYTNPTATGHTKNVDDGGELCSCGYVVVQPKIVKSTVEAHTFSGDTCKYCGYKKSHTHVATMCGNPKTTYTKPTSTGHTKNVDDGGGLCSCGYVVVAPKIVKSTVEAHTFSNNVCKYCGYKKATHTHVESKRGKTSTTYSNPTASGHTKTYYDGDRICSCGYVIGKGKTTTTTEAHTYDSNYVCTKCGYKHTHKANASTVPSTSYKDPTENGHTKCFNPGNDICSCGYAVIKRDTVYTTEAHTYDSNYVCTLCGYKHTHNYTLKNVSTTYENITDSKHTKVYYAGDQVCSCGHVKSRSEVVRTTDAHTYDANYVCKVCGYKHTHKANASTVPTTSYKDSNENGHTKCFNPGNDICSCGYVVIKRDTVYTTEAHTYDSNYVCTKCGYKHTHKYTLKNVSTTYVDISNSRHTKVYYAGDQVCACGHVKSRSEVVRTGEAHTYNANYVCKLCGYKHTHQGVMTGPAYTKYEQKDNFGHYKVNYNGKDLCSCGYEMGPGKSSRSVEPHTMAAGYCIYCGTHTGFHVHKATASPKVVKVSEKYANEMYHDVITEYGATHCSCGAIVEEAKTVTTQEKHTYSDEYVCTKCGYKHKHKSCANVYPMPKYKFVDKKTHLVISYTEGELCCCGCYTVTPRITGYFTEDHSFDDNGLCKYCGYDKVTGKEYAKTAVTEILLGEFADESNLAGVAGNVAVGFIPIAGDIADARDCVASIVAKDKSAKDIAINCGAFIIPFFVSASSLRVIFNGGEEIVESIVKHGDEVFDVTVKHSDELIETSVKVSEKVYDFVFKNSDEYNKFLKAAEEYGDEFLELFSKKGDEAYEIVAKHADDLVKAASKKFDDVDDMIRSTGDFKDTAAEHIFKGNSSGGYHYEGIEGANGKVTKVITPPDANGVYEATVEIGGKTKVSTFFPKDWTPDEVVSMIEEAYHSPSLRNITGNTYEALTSSGVWIDMYLDSNGKIISAFPVIK